MAAVAGVGGATITARYITALVPALRAAQEKAEEAFIGGS